jgi:hypothetical protein
MLVLIGWENVGIRTDLRVDRGGQHGPPMVLLRIGQGCDLNGETRARLHRRGGPLRRTSPAGASRAAGRGHDGRADRMRPPRAGAAPAVSLPLALRRGTSRVGLRQAGEPLGGHLLYVMSHGFGFVSLSRGGGLRVRRGPWTRRHDHQPAGLHGNSSVAVLHLAVAAYAWPMPAAGRLVLGRSRLLDQTGSRRWRTCPSFECLPDGPGAREECDHVAGVLQAQAQGPATRGLTSRHHPTHPRQASGQPRLKRPGGFHTSAAVAITSTEAPGDPASAAHAQTEEHRFAVVTTVCARPRGWPRRPQCLRFVLIGPIPGNRGGVLRQPGRRDGIHRQGVEGDRTKHRVEMGRTQRIAEVPHTVIVAGRTREARLQQRDPPPLFEPSPDLIKGLMPIQNREHQGVDPTPTRERRRRVRGEETVNDRGHFQAPSHPEDQRHMRSRVNVLH